MTYTTKSFDPSFVPTVALICLSTLVAISLFLLQKKGKKKNDILDSILTESAPLAAANELNDCKGLTCKCLLDGKPLVLTKDAAVADYIFNGPSRSNYIRRPAADEGLKELGMFHCGLIWNNDIPTWKKVRGCFQKALGETGLQTAAKVARNEAKILLESLTNGGEATAVDLLQVSRRITFRATLNVFFGINSSNFASLHIDEEAFIAAIVAYFKAWEFFLLRPTRKWDEAFKVLHCRAIETLQKHVENMVKSSEANSLNGRAGDSLFFENLKQVCQTEHCSQKLLQQSCLEMLLAGTDTSSVTAYYTLLGLAGDVSFQDELRADLGRPLERDGPRRQPLLDSVVNETLRFKPVGPVVLREAVAADERFPGDSSIQAGTAILIHLAEMNLCNDFWDDPKSFQPKRFLESTTVGADKFFPFGRGPKGCIGMHLGRREVNAIVETIVLNYRMSIEGTETLGSLTTHWDIANQPENPCRIYIEKIN